MTTEQPTPQNPKEVIENFEFERLIVIGVVIGGMAYEAAQRLGTTDLTAIQDDVAAQIAAMPGFDRLIGITEQ